MRNSEIRRQHKEKSSTVKRFFFSFHYCFIAGAGAAAGFFLSVSSGLPDISANIAPDASSRIYDAKGAAYYYGSRRGKPSPRVH